MANGNKRRSLRGRSGRVVSKPNDRVTLKGKLQLATVTTSASGNQTYELPINISALGNRVGNVSLAFLKYKINYLKLRYVSEVGSTTAGIIQLGIADDVDNYASTTAVNPDQLRSSSVQAVWKSTSFNWSPADSAKWYFINTTTAGDTSSDPRLYQPCTVMWAFQNVPSSTTVGILYVEYSICFDGASPANIT